MISSDNLPPGFEDLGDPSNLVPTPTGPQKASDLVDAHGAPVAPPVMPEPKTIDLSPVQWAEDPEAPGMFFPILQVTEQMTKVGASRPFKQFLPGERMMFAAAFTSDVTTWLFGEPLYLENFTDEATEFVPNPKFHELPTQIPE